ncbi:unnamed protein product [Rotaria socialis]
MGRTGGVSLVFLKRCVKFYLLFLIQVINLILLFTSLAIHHIYLLVLKQVESLNRLVSFVIIQPSTSLSFVNYVQPNNDDDAQQYVAYLSNIVHFPNETKINFETIVGTAGSADILFILQACPNVIDLKISPFITQDLVTIIVERFLSLTDIEVQVASFKYFTSAIDILLSHQQNLSYLNICYSTPPIFHQSFSRNDIIDKRRQAFGFKIIDEDKVTVSRREGFIQIRLS